MAKFTDYTQKTKPADADLLLIHDNAGAANKKTPFSGVWSWILDKLASAVISQLETTNKSIIPAINELNSKSNAGCAIKKNVAKKDLQDDEDIRQYIYDNYRDPSHIVAFSISSDLLLSNKVPTRAGGFMFAYFSSVRGYALIIFFTYTEGIYTTQMQNNVWLDWKQI